jgi:hypothetical protein
LTINLLGELPFQFRNSLFEHVPMDGRCGGGKIAPRPCQCQLNRVTLRRAFALLGRQGATRSAPAIGGFRLLKLDVFTLEASGHCPQISMLSVMPNAAALRNSLRLSRDHLHEFLRGGESISRST